MNKKEKREYDRKWYANRTHAQKTRKQDIQKVRRVELRDRLIKYKEEHPCSCGESFHACLDFHHTTDDKEVCVADAVRSGWAWDRILKEIEKCDILCANCHRKFHWKD